MQKVKKARPAVSEPVACAQCGSTDAIQIDMTLPDGTSVHFCSCHRCENRWWENDGQSFGLETVLEIVRQPTR